MPSILDIAPPEVAAELVDIRGTVLKVRAIRHREWAALLRRFPDMRRQAAGIELSQDEAILNGIDTMPAIIAIGLDAPGDEKTEASILANLSDDEQTRLVGIIWRLTNPPSPLAGSPAMAGLAGNGAAVMPTLPSQSSN